MHPANTARRLVVALPILVVGALLGACSSSESDKPSTSSSSSSSSGTSGSSSSSGTSGSSGSDAGEDASTGKKKNAETGCTKNEECESNICFMGGTQSYCAVTCTAADAQTVCAAPFTGSCNKQGYCKRD